MNTIVAIPFDEELAGFIGKKGSENSITFYNRKLNGNVVVGIMPSSLEEKFYALPQCLLVANQVLVSTKSLDSLFGEALIGCALLNKRTIFTKDNDITKLISGISLENVSFAGREEILGSITSFAGNKVSDAQVKIEIDKSFNVKGAGTVALGVVISGTVKVHDALYHNSGKQVTVRSIQSQDEDIKEAAVGTRVGLALKGIDESDMQKGDILSTNVIKRVKSLELEINKSGFVNEAIEEGKTYSIAIGFSYTIATVEKTDGNTATVRLEKAIPVEAGNTFLLVRVVSPRIFASGKVMRIPE